MLVGRDAELRELLSAADRARAAGRGWTALVSGEAGIGKSRLAAEVADRVRAAGVAVARAACPPGGGAPPYWPWAQLLDRLGRSEALAVPDSADPSLARFLLFASVSDALRAAAPVLLVLDDLHWADEPSLRLLDALPSHVGDAPVLVLGTYRDTEPVAAALSGIVAERRLVLRGLDAGELAAAVAEATGEEVAPGAVTELHRRTAGNPFFAAEVVRLRRAGGATDLPGGVRAVLERRIDALPAGVETALRAAAALDPGATVALDAVLLAATAGTTPAGLAELLRPAVDAGLLRAADGLHRFPHALVPETLAVRTPPEQRLDLHRRAGAALDARLRGGAGDPAAVARHLLAAAGLSGDPDEAGAAAAASARAARSARAGAAYEDAVRWFEASLAALAAAPDRSDRGELLCALGDAALAAGDRARSRAAFGAAAGHARRRRRPDLLAAAALGVSGGPAGFEVDLADPDRTTLLEEALAALPLADSAVRATVAARLSVALAFTGAEPRRRSLADDAVAMARRVGDPGALAGALAARCDALAGPDHVAERRAAAAEIVSCARTAGDRARELLGRRLLVVALAEAGDWAGVDIEIEAYARAAEPLRQPGLTWYVPLWRGTRAAMRGDTAARARHTAALRRLVDLSASPNAEMLALTQWFVGEVQAGRAPAVLPLMERMIELTGYDGVAAHVTSALLHGLGGDRGEAARLLAAHRTARSSAPRDSEWLPETVQAAMTAVQIGDTGAAAGLYATLRPYAGLFAVEGILAGTWGCVDAHLGRLARMLGRPDDAREHFAAAGRLDAAAGDALAERTRRWTAGGGRPAAVPPGEGEFRRDGEVWTLTYAGRPVRLRDTKGLRDLAVLLARPGRDVAVHELTGAGPGNTGSDRADATAVAAYRRRLVDLEEERAEAEAMHDPVRAERAGAERDALVGELAAVTGLGGRVRREGSDAERMRKAVGNRIRQALSRIEAVHPELGRHLRVSVRTGTFCRYQPERAVRWRVRDRAGA